MHVNANIPTHTHKHTQLQLQVLKSTCAAGEQFNAAPFVIDELRVIGSRCGPIDRALELLHLGKTDGNKSAQDANPAGTMLAPLNPRKFVTQTFPLSKADEAIECAAARTTMKVQIICSEN